MAENVTSFTDLGPLAINALVDALGSEQVWTSCSAAVVALPAAEVARRLDEILARLSPFTYPHGPLRVLRARLDTQH